MYELLIDLSFEDNAELEQTLGQHTLKLGEIKIDCTGYQVGEVVTVKITGELLTIIEYLDGIWQSTEQAITEVTEAIKDGRCAWKPSARV